MIAAMRTLRLLLCLITAAWMTTALGQEAATNRATELRERPAADARALAPLPARTAVQVVGREGGWTQVLALEQRGWLPAFHIRFAAVVESAPASPMAGLTSLLGVGGKRAPETSKVATIGVRGLTREEFRAASPDLEALKRLQSFRASPEDAARFAREGGMTATVVAYPTKTEGAS
jgi:hypothetical protein